jgi:large subunit ribosomal protein L24
MKIHQGDTVLIISGKDKGKQGTVLRVLSSKNHVVVEGINMRTRHIKKTVQASGQRIQYEASLDASKVMIVDPKTKKPTRIGYVIDAKTGSKKRIAKASGEVITKAKATAKSKTSAKSSKEDGAGKSEKKAKDAAKPESKQAFWKRGGGKTDAGDVKEGDNKTGGAAALPMAHRSQGG